MYIHIYGRSSRALGCTSAPASSCQPLPTFALRKRTTVTNSKKEALGNVQLSHNPQKPLIGSAAQKCPTVAESEETAELCLRLVKNVKLSLSPPIWHPKMCNYPIAFEKVHLLPNPLLWLSKVYNYRQIRACSAILAYEIVQLSQNTKNGLSEA